MNRKTDKRRDLILASASPRRRELLSRLGIPFRVEAPDVVELDGSETRPDELVRVNAARKAAALAAKYPDAVVLAADTTVFFDGVIFNKPRDLKEAAAMLRRLSGETHTVFTGLDIRCDADAGEYQKVVTSRVTFKRLTDVEIQNYFMHVNPLDKAGAYGIQEKEATVVSHFEGSFSNIMGLPMKETRDGLHSFGF